MTISIITLNEDNISDAKCCDGAFTVDACLTPCVENGHIAYSYQPIPQYTKRYGEDAIDFNSYIDNPDKFIYLAYVDGKIAGRVMLRRNWNRFAYIEDIVVDVHYRRQGIGRKLMENAIAWAKRNSLPGIMLETQNNNTAACKFYESLGFTLGGFDSYLYRGINPQTEEMALFWYLVF